MLPLSRLRPPWCRRHHSSLVSPSTSIAVALPRSTCALSTSQHSRSSPPSSLRLTLAHHPEPPNRCRIP
ncbi:hypothetical protein Syun_012369 [Stephania yunnanensis]|uniref:Uncharacterized protein n=1 Tax=Stephania yunnanensis TaxID=152371 RepID=A0AAP0K031_9MAGN